MTNQTLPQSFIDEMIYEQELSLQELTSMVDEIESIIDETISTKKTYRLFSFLYRSKQTQVPKYVVAELFIQVMMDKFYTAPTKEQPFSYNALFQPMIKLSREFNFDDDFNKHISFSEVIYRYLNRQDKPELIGKVFETKRLTKADLDGSYTVITKPNGSKVSVLTEKGKANGLVGKYTIKDYPNGQGFTGFEFKPSWTSKMEAWNGETMKGVPNDLPAVHQGTNHEGKKVRMSIVDEFPLLADDTDNEVEDYRKIYSTFEGLDSESTDTFSSVLNRWNDMFIEAGNKKGLDDLDRQIIIGLLSGYTRLELADKVTHKGKAPNEKTIRRRIDEIKAKLTESGLQPKEARHQIKPANYYHKFYPKSAKPQTLEVEGMRLAFTKPLSMSNNIVITDEYIQEALQAPSIVRQTIGKAPVNPYTKYSNTPYLATTGDQHKPSMKYVTGKLEIIMRGEES